jgi:copper chaperone CopZ
MIRALFAVAALCLAPAAFACGGRNCEGCAHPPATETTAVDVEAAAGTKVTLAIAGMHCGACATKITTALTGTAGVNAVRVDSATGEARIAYDAATVDVNGLIAAVATAGAFTASLPPAGG